MQIFKEATTPIYFYVEKIFASSFQHMYKRLKEKLKVCTINLFIQVNTYKIQRRVLPKAGRIAAGQTMGRPT